MYCSNCGSYVSNDTKICPSCGKRITQAAKVKVKVHKKTENRSATTSGEKLNAIICPQCGSQDIDFNLETNAGICNSCGTQVLMPKPENYNFYIGGASDDDIDEPLLITESVPELSMADFIDRVLKQAALDDAPIDFFGAGFGKPFIKKYEVYEETVEGYADYTASVGYHRQEPYQETETYYEDGKRKERTVTKYKKVTDWSPISGRTEVYDTNYAEISGEELFDKELYSSSHISDKTKLISQADPSSLGIKSRNETLLGHSFNSDVKYVLPGDESRDIHYRETIEKTERGINNCFCYNMEIEYNGKTYIKKMFPFGQGNVGGDEIEWVENTLITDGLIWKDSFKKIKSALWVLLFFAALSIVFSLIMSHIVPVIISYVISLLAFFRFLVKSSSIAFEIKDGYDKNREEIVEKKAAELIAEYCKED